MKFIFFYILGVFLCAVGMFFIIININLINIGYTFLEYVKFIISSIECLMVVIGTLILIVVYERG